MPAILRVLTLVPHEKLGPALAAELARIPSLEVAQSRGVFPDANELLRLIRIQNPDFLMVDVEDLTRASVLLKSVDEFLPGMPVIGVANKVDAELAHRLMHWGIREYVTAVYPGSTDGADLLCADLP